MVWAGLVRFGMGCFGLVWFGLVGLVCFVAVVAWLILLGKFSMCIEFVVAF